MNLEHFRGVLDDVKDVSKALSPAKRAQLRSKLELIDMTLRWTYRAEAYLQRLLPPFAANQVPEDPDTIELRKLLS